MPLYRYEALDRTGKTVHGAMQVANEQDLTVRLQAMGYQPTTVEIAQRSLRQAQARTVQQGASGGAVVGGSTLSASERSLARMFHQLHIALRAGMPAHQAITTVAAQTHEAPVRSALNTIALGVQRGETISVGMERFPRMFSLGDVGMVRAAELGGFLPDAVASLANQHEQDDNTRRRLRVWVWFFHSNVLMLLLIPPCAFFLKDSIPALDVKPGLAAAGQAFMLISLPLGAAYAGLLAFLEHARRDPVLKLKWHRFLLRVPMAGKINSLRSNAVFLRTLQQLYHSGVAAGTSWETASGSVPNLYLAERFASGQPVVDATGKVSQGMQQVGLLELTDIGMVATGESAGEVEQALNYLANRYEDETRVALGAAVVKGAVAFTAWAFILGGVGMAVLSWGYAQGLLKLGGMEM